MKDLLIESYFCTEVVWPETLMKKIKPVVTEKDEFDNRDE